MEPTDNESGFNSSRPSSPIRVPKNDVSPRLASSRSDRPMSPMRSRPELLSSRGLASSVPSTSESSTQSVNPSDLLEPSGPVDRKARYKHKKNKSRKKEGLRPTKEETENESPSETSAQEPVTKNKETAEETASPSPVGEDDLLTRPHRGRTIVVYGGPPRGPLALGSNNSSQMNYSDREAELIRDIIKFIAINAPQIIIFLYDSIDKAGQPAFTQATVNLSFSTNVTLELLKCLLEDEFAKNMSAGKEILRENGIVIQFLKVYFKIIGMTFLQNLLGKFIYQLCTSEKYASYEYDPNKTTDPEEAKKNKEELINKMNQLFNQMTSPKMTDTIPPGIRILCKQVAQLAQKYTPERVHLYIGSFLMLRYINPAITSPEQFGIIQKNKTVPQNTRKNLVTITRMLQSTSNYTGKEKKDSGIDFTIWQKLLYDWFDEIINVKYNPQSVHEDISPQIHVQDLHIIHRIVFELKQEILKLLPSDSLRQGLSSILDRLGAYQNKEKFSFLQENHQRVVLDLLENRRENEEAMYVGYLKVKKKVKKDKYTEEHFVLIVGIHRIMVLNESGKLIVDVHHIHIEKIQSLQKDHLKLTYSIPINGKEKVIEGETEANDTDQIISCIHRAFDYTFPGMPREYMFKLDIQPTDRRSNLQTSRADEPCDALVHSYKSLCDFYQQVPVDFLCHDLENFYPNLYTFDFKKITAHYQKPITDVNALPLLHAIAYNRHFTSLRLHSFQFKEPNFQGLIKLASFNVTLTSLTLSDISVAGGRQTKCFAEMFQKLAYNTKMPLQKLNLANTPLDSNAAQALLKYLAEKRDSFSELTLSGCFTKTNAKIILDGLIFSSSSVKKLEVLKWARTKLGELSSEFSKLIQKCTNLLELDISDTGLIFPQLIKDGIKSHCNKLHKINISNNKYPKEQMWEGIVSLFGDSSVSYELDVSNTMIPIKVLSDILLLTEGNISVNASNNNLGINGAQLIGEIASKIVKVDRLDLSDNGFGDQGVVLLMEGLCNNTCLVELNLSYNFKENDKFRGQLIHTLEMLSTSICPLEVLLMRGNTNGRLKESITSFIDSLVENTTITELDITGHAFGDKGAIALAHIFYQNRTLTTVHYDDNGISFIGLINIAEALNRNQHLKLVPIPYMDVSKVFNEMATQGDRDALTAVLERMERYTWDR